MDWAGSIRFLGALLNLLIFAKQLDILEMAKDRAYTLADKQVTLAELIVSLHCLLLDKTETYYNIANNAPIYQQQYECAVSLSNTDVIREINSSMNGGLDTTDMYSSGLRYDYIESSMAAIVFSSSGQFAMAYRAEDDLNELTLLNKYTHMVNSINGTSLYTGHQAMQRLANDTLNLAESTSRLAERHLESFVTTVVSKAAETNSDKSSNQTLTQRVRNDGGLDTSNSRINRAPVEERQVFPRSEINIIQDNNQSTNDVNN